jgi:hypothetical protein
MRHFVILIVLFISATAFSQNAADSIIYPKPVTSVVIQKIDTAQILRIDNIEKNLSAYYAYNRRSHTLLFLSMGMSLVGILLSNSQDNTASGVITLAGGFVGLVGTVVYLDSFKFLNFKPKRKEIRGMTYY